MDKIVVAVVAVVFIVWAISRCAGGKGDANGETETATNTNTQNGASGNTKPGQIFIVWDSVRLRNGPSRDSSALMTLYKNAPLTFTGKRSNNMDEISQDGIKYREPWIEVRAANNKVGWVFGGSVRVYPR